ncbi:response regulator [Actinomadura latina]|uniref:Response regulator transcription factor n=1 Tax=Actinomadura latina TaxID=163603 RepID=A0A846ZAN4_9ACTN|nr:response regulator transcription factor [Actinomadura latina]NKZ08787.1 response regulator transcription factor [Actinomadura latina]
MTRDLNRKIRIVLVDDHRLFREGVREILSATGDLEVLAEGGSCAEAVELAAEHRPDILLLDVHMPGMSPVMTVRRVAEVAPATRIVVLSTRSDNDLMLNLVAAGAAGYLSKNIGGYELCSDLRSLAADGMMFAARVQRNIGGDDAVRSAVALTDREIEVLRLVSKAMSNSQIAMNLCVSEATVKRHLTNAFTKLKARSRLDAVNRAIVLGMLEGPGNWPFLS